MYYVFIKGNIASQEKSSMEQLSIGAQSYSARLVLLLARFSRSQQNGLKPQFTTTVVIKLYVYFMRCHIVPIPVNLMYFLSINNDSIFLNFAFLGISIGEQLSKLLPTKSKKKKNAPT